MCDGSIQYTRPPEIEEYTDADGLAYYYNTITGETSYSKAGTSTVARRANSASQHNTERTHDARFGGEGGGSIEKSEAHTHLRANATHYSCTAAHGVRREACVAGTLGVPCTFGVMLALTLALALGIGVGYWY